MSRGWPWVRAVLRLLPVVVLLAVVVPGAAVRPTTLTLTKVEVAEGYDVGADVVWVLVLGADDLGLTDAIQLLGVDTRTGAAAAIGIPRDTYVDLGGGEMGKINAAYARGADVAAAVVEDLVGIAPAYVLLTEGQGFVAMVDALGGVEVDSPLAFTTDEGGVRVKEGRNRFDGTTALRFAETRLFGDTPGPGDFIRVENHQALLLGLLAGFQEQDDDRGFIEATALGAIEGIEADGASPLDLYRLLNALTGVDRARADGCVLVGTEDVDPAGNQVVRPDLELARRLGREAADDATFETDC